MAVRGSPWQSVSVCVVRDVAVVKVDCVMLASPALLARLNWPVRVARQPRRRALVTRGVVIALHHASRISQPSSSSSVYGYNYLGGGFDILFFGGSSMFRFRASSVCEAMRTRNFISSHQQKQSARS